MHTLIEIMGHSQRPPDISAGPPPEDGCSPSVSKERNQSLISHFAIAHWNSFQHFSTLINTYCAAFMIDAS